jgi:hypothetical protein
MKHRMTSAGLQGRGKDSVMPVHGSRQKQAGKDYTRNSTSRSGLSTPQLVHSTPMNALPVSGGRIDGACRAT